MSREESMPQQIEFPYLPEGGRISYVDTADPYIRAAFEVARDESLDPKMPVGSVIVKDGKIIGRGANGSTWHETNGCERKRLGIPTGQGYDLCEGCSPANHSETKAIADALQKLEADDLRGAEMYLWGHWWCCQDCWKVMQGAGINEVYLLQGSEVDFNLDAPGNSIGNQIAVFQDRL